jgi:hypothetical protein
MARYWKVSTPEKMPVADNVRGALERCLAIQLVLELDAGDWVGLATHKELPISPIHLKALQANIGDERVHYQHFKAAATVYPISDRVIKEAQSLREDWLQVAGEPIEKVAQLEAGVFVPSLAFMLASGSQAFFEIGAPPAQDEQRHAALNRLACRKMGINPAYPRHAIASLTKATLAWVFEGLNLETRRVGVLTTDSLIQASDDLVQTNYSETLNRLLSQLASYEPNFEKENSQQKGYY